MIDKPSPFDAIFAEDDELGILATKSAAPARSTDESIALSQFEAINAFIDEHGVLPGSTEGGREPGLSEFTLESHLEAFREESTYREMLSALDRHGLLGDVPDQPMSMAEILASDDTILKSESEDIFLLTHVSARDSAKSAPDEIARRVRCANFADYAPIFATIKSELTAGKRFTKRFAREGSIVPGVAFILNGIVSYIADVSQLQRRGKERDARIRVIFDNGTEGNHFLRSFARVLYDDEHGKQIFEAEPEVSGPLFTGILDDGHPDDRMTGNIYVVESLSTHPSIAALRGRLYKIGFTTQPVAERIANADADPTFLLAPVRVVTTFETVNLPPRKLEQLIHQFFAEARLQVDVLLGRTVTPREWFVVPVELVREAITRMLDGSIMDYRYDHLSRKIVRR